MISQRRRLLRLLPFCFGSTFILRRKEFGLVALAATQPTIPRQSAVTTAQSEMAGRGEMEKVTGIGGLFFRAHDPAALGRWYQQHLGVSLAPSSYQEAVWQQEAGPTVFSPFPETSDYFGDAHKVWMVNFRVRDLDKMVAQLRAKGIEVKIDPQLYPNGRFARLCDPEGNPIELWQPENSGAPH
jgi:glyoxylase I family protein